MSVPSLCQGRVLPKSDESLLFGMAAQGMRAKQQLFRFMLVTLMIVATIANSVPFEFATLPISGAGWKATKINSLRRAESIFGT